MGPSSATQDCKLAQNRLLARIVADKLQLQWSLEQIAGVAQAYLSVRRELPGVTRDDLSGLGAPSDSRTGRAEASGRAASSAERAKPSDNNLKPSTHY
jgi:hypothetical protein